MPRTNFPAVRACLFDMDGLLLDTEDIATQCHTLMLAKYGRPPLPAHIKAQMMGRNGPSARQILQDWAKLPISDEQYRKEVAEHQKKLFGGTKPLPGVEELLRNLSKTKDGEDLGEKLSGMFEVFEQHRRVLGDDPRLTSGRGKPFPDIYQLALKTINDSLASGEKPITPEECLVFEDSVTGVEAGRRAGMRAVWCPQQVLMDAYAGREAEVLAGRTGAAVDTDMHQVGELGDGWAELLGSLVGFPYEKYGIVVPAKMENI